jgi:hypothetical protein
MKNKMYQNLETIATIMWLIMDFLWLCGFGQIAALISIPTIFLMILACIKFQGLYISELHSMNATVCWLIMNSMWICSEIVDKENYLLTAKCAFVCALIFICLSLRASRKENKPTDFKRLKIK